MQFLVKAYDGDRMLEKRMKVRPRHFEGMKALGKQIIAVGSLLDRESQNEGLGAGDGVSGQGRAGELSKERAICCRRRLAED